MEWVLYFLIVKKKITHALYVTPTWYSSRQERVRSLHRPTPPPPNVIFALQAIDIAAVNHNKFFSIILPMILNAFAAVSK